MARLRRRDGGVRSVREYFSTVRTLVRLVWRASPVLFAVSLVLTLVGGIVPTANIMIISALLDALARSAQIGAASAAPPANFVVLLVLLAVVGLLEQVVSRLEQIVSQLQGARIGNHVQMLIAAKAAEIDLAEFEDAEFHNRMLTAAHEAPHRPKQMVDELTNTVSTLTTFATLAAVLVLWQAWVVPVIVLASLATLGVSLSFGTALVDLVSKRAEIERKKLYLSTLFTSDQAVKEVRLFGLRDHLLSMLHGLIEFTYRQDRRLAFRELAYSVPAGAILGVVQVALIAFTAFQALAGTISVGQFNLYTQSIVQLGALVPGLMFAAGALHENNLFAAKLFDFLETQPRVEAPRSGSRALAESITRTPRVQFHNVSFRYPGTDHRVLENVSFEVCPGEAVALVGENGAGKSTLVKLLTGLYEPTEGEILFDGVDINDLDRDDLRAYLSVIFQDYVVYHFSARENVGVGRVSHIDDGARIEDAARRSGLDRVLAGLPAGYDTVLGRFWESGHELSGGQQQLVALARALLRDAPILILDEPSAALDIYTEQRFFQRLLEDRDAKTARTVVFISHRFTTVRRADRILLLEKGRLVESGTHEQLVGRGGRYAEMFEMQAAMYRDTRPSSEAPDAAPSHRGARP